LFFGINEYIPATIVAISLLKRTSFGKSPRKEVGEPKPIPTGQVERIEGTRICWIGMMEIVVKR